MFLGVVYKGDRVGLNCISRGDKIVFYYFVSHRFLRVILAVILVALLSGTFQLEEV